MKKNIYKVSMIAAVLALTYSGCKKDFLEKTNPNAISSDLFWKTQNDAIRGVNAVYAPLQHNGLYFRHYHMLADMVSDETQGTSSLNTQWVSLKLFTGDANNELSTNLWGACYTGIARANLVLENVPGIAMSDSVKNVVLGQAKFLRGLYYWHLVANFGDVPLITAVPKASDPDNVRLPSRTPKLQVYAQMVQDFKDAEAVLPKAYTSGDDLGRATKGAAQAYLGKTYLYMASDDQTNKATHWQNAANKLGDVIASNTYTLISNYRDNHTSTNENNQESVFEVQFGNGGGSVWNGTDVAGISEGHLRSVEFGVKNHAFHNVIPSAKVEHAYEPGDIRRGLSMYGPDSTFNKTVVWPTSTGGELYFKEDPNAPGIFQQAAGWNSANDTYVDSSAGYAIRKYEHDGIDYENTSTGSEINIRIMRYADVLLMKAEAENELGNTGTAATYLNMVRTRAGLPNTTASDVPSMRNAIIHERMVELAFEQHRMNDLRRWQKLNYVDMTTELEYTDSKGVLHKPTLPKYLYWGIPVQELSVNPNLQQNPGW